MFNGPEIWIVLAVVLLLFGGSQLPKLARNIGKAQKEFKDGLAEGREADEATKSEPVDDDEYVDHERRRQPADRPPLTSRPWSPFRPHPPANADRASACAYVGATWRVMRRFFRIRRRERSL